MPPHQKAHAKINGLQALRAIAAFVVVYNHAYTRAILTWPDQSTQSLAIGFHDLVAVGQFGVDLFFVLSGFLMTHLHAQQFGIAGVWRTFLTRRIIRIVPLYWVLSAVGLALLFAMPSLFTFHTSTEWPWIAGSFLFVPWPTSSGFFAPIIGAGWTLDYEMYFYMLFTIALLSRRGLVGLCVFLVISAVAGSVFRPSHPWLALLTGPLLLEFLMGIATANLVARVRLPIWAVRVCFIAAASWIAATALNFPRIDRVLIWGLPSAVLVASVVWADLPWKSAPGRLLVLLGNASYSIYLFQIFAVPGFSRLFAACHLEQRFNFDAMVLMLAVCATAAGVAVHFGLEQPLTKWARRILRNKHTNLASAA